ncbi:hypothetical protein AB0D08_25890 [Kitasatospora sp. NPDC048540]|uniref:hypothetical protein n=1 Tax=unclassified Kitasatospora TaxID=2633591 RepID=UPI00068B264F|nr:hypothetical protein [Kitasatospora sp. MBT63]
MTVPATPHRADDTAVPRRALLLGGAAAVAAVVFGADSAPEPLRPFTARPLPHDGLLTNEYAFRHPDAPDAHPDPDWVVTSGSLFADGGALWTGTPDGQSPDPASARHTDSAVFRLVTRRRDFADCTVRAEVLLEPPVTTSRTPAQDWDGGHLWLRYRSPQELYAVSFRRRDGVVVVKRKTPDEHGAADAEGSYETIAEAKHAMEYGSWHSVEASVADTLTGAVRLRLAVDGRVLLDVKDQGGERITAPGGVGVRADNSDLRIRAFSVGPARF